MAEFVCTACDRTGERDDGLTWYEGSIRDVELDPDETAIEDGVFLCEDCYKRLDPEERPRWKPIE